MRVKNINATNGNTPLPISVFLHSLIGALRDTIRPEGSKGEHGNSHMWLVIMWHGHRLLYMILHALCALLYSSRAKILQRYPVCVYCETKIDSWSSCWISFLLDELHASQVQQKVGTRCFDVSVNPLATWVKALPTSFCGWPYRRSVGESWKAWDPKPYRGKVM